MRRFIIACVGVAALAAAGVALAQGPLNTYTGTVSFSPSAAGSTSKPVPIGFTERYTAANATTGLLAAPLTNVLLTLDGVKVNYKAFPTCSAAKISAAKSDAGCPKKALIGTGLTSAQLVQPNLTTVVFPCQPLLDLWNGGNGQIVFFFVITPTHTCGPLQTGSAAPYVGTIKQVGPNVAQNTPLPPDVSTNAGGVGLYGSLQLEAIKWAKTFVTVKGKKVYYLSAIGCKAGKRNYSYVFTATDSSGAPSTATVTGSTACK